MAARMRSATRRRIGLGVVVLRLGDHDQALLAPFAGDAEGDDVAGAHAVDVDQRPLDVLGEDVATADDDEVLDAAAHHHLAVEQVARSPVRSQPSWNSSRVDVGPLVVAGHDRGAADLQLAHLAIAQHPACDGIDDADLETRHRPPQHGELAAAVGPGSTGRAKRSVSSTRRSTQSRRSPSPGAGNVPAMATSAMPKAGKMAPGRRP